jgi:Secretion system C-terminal sorting domain
MLKSTHWIKLTFISLLVGVSIAFYNLRPVHKYSNPVETEEEERDEQDGMEQAIRQEFRMTRDLSLNRIPTERLVKANETRNRLLASGRQVSALTWQERGPNNVAGRTRTVLVDKRDATGNTVFAGSVGGGIWKTTNFKSSPPTWTVVNDFLSNLAVTNIIQDPSNLNTFYASTGEGWFNVDAIRGIGILKSTDGGTTWVPMASTANFQYTQDIIFDKNGNLYAAVRNDDASAARGVLRSTDGGATWTQVLAAPLAGFTTGRAADLEVAANGDVYATLGIFSAGSIFKSPVNGASTGALGSWVDVSPTAANVLPAAATVGPFRRIEIATAPSDAQRVYAICQSNTTNEVTAMFRSNNGGTTWNTVNLPSSIVNNGANSQVWFNLILGVDPNNADNITVGGLHVGRSTNGGTTWEQIINTTGFSSVHVDIHALVYDGSSNLLCGNDGGIHYSQNINTATPTFVNKNTGYNVTQYYATDLHPNNVNYFLAGAQDNGTQKFTQPGINATTNARGGDGGFCHIDQTDGLIQVVSTVFNNYAFSIDGGASFTARNLNSNGQFINPTDYDDDGNVLFCADAANRYMYITNIETGSPTNFIRQHTEMGGREVTAVKVDPNSSDVLWLAANSGSLPPMLLKIRGRSTATSSVGFTVTLPLANGAYISSIDVQDGDSTHLLATVSNYGVNNVWESKNNGVSWTALDGNLPDMPVRWGIFAPTGGQLNGPAGPFGGILLGTEVGVWTTSTPNGGSTVWAPDNSGLANVRVHMLKYSPIGTRVVAATHGRGLFTTSIPGSNFPTGVGNTDNTKNFIKYIAASPNNLLISTGNLTTQTMEVMVMDITGKMMISNKKAYQATNINISGLASGAYILRITGNKKEQFTQRFIKP